MENTAKKPSLFEKLKASRLGQSTHRFNEKRAVNTGKYKATNLILMLCFPVFITTMAEIIQMKTPAKFVLFLFDKPSIVLFNIIICALLFGTLTLIVKRVWISATAIGVFYTTLAIVERFKFNTSGNHLILTDMTLAKNIKNLTSFAYIKITLPLVIYVLIVFAYLGAVFMFNPIVKMKLAKRLCASAVCASIVGVTVVSPTLAIPVYSFFDIDTSNSDNVFRVNEKFDNNNFLAFLTQTTTEFLNRKVHEPENYDIQTIGDMLLDATAEDNTYQKPNVIFIMSEAFADFRIFDELDISDEIYAGFDKVRNSEGGFAGEAVVPAFGSFTVKTEFELNFGLPVKSLNDPNMPYRLLLEREQQTIPAYFKSLGYSTNYIHTFTGTFYSRQRVFANYGFDRLMFEDSLDVDTEYFRSYISDTTIFNQIDKLITETDEPVYIHTTTMQNHQPYESDDENVTQLDFYLEGIEDMTGNLTEFIETLRSIDEPTVVCFIGDHFPCFKGEDSVYNTLDITAENCSDLYVQQYFIWNNFGADYSSVPQERVSAFWLPYIVIDLIGAPKTDFIETMLDKMADIPVYTTNYDNTIGNDEELDMFTYDIVMGDRLIEEVEE